VSTDPSPKPLRPGPRPRFTRAEVVETALRVIDEDGAEMLSMRRVAEALGVGVMTLYGYFPNKEEMLKGVAELALSQAYVEPAVDASWEDRVRAGVGRIHGVYRRHPQLAQLILAQTSATPRLFRSREGILGALREAGFDETTALLALGALISYALGFGGMQASSAPGDLPERIAELPADEFPNLTAAADRYDIHLSDEAFQYGLELLLAGLRAQLAAR
jgi:AcrR family transcriptional regulator